MEKGSQRFPKYFPATVTTQLTMTTTITSSLSFTLMAVSVDPIM